MSNNRDALRSILDQGGFALVLGAGCSVEAGLPTWEAALEQLADKLDPHSQAYATVMREEIRKGQLLKAAELLYMADWTEEDRARALSDVFGAKHRMTSRLMDLAKLPYHGVITTNFDTSFIEAAARSSLSLLQFTEAADDLAAARICRNQYILRIHGRIEVPASLTLAQRHFEALSKKPEYAGFVQSLVTDAPVIFFGFSFRDAYFAAALSAISDATGGRMQHKGCALLPAEPEVGLADLLRRLNILPVVYSPNDSHAEAWRLMRSAVTATPALAESYSERRLRQTLAWVLTHMRVKQNQDLQTAVISAAVLAEASHIGPVESIDAAVEALRQSLALPRHHSNLVRDTLAALLQQRRVRLAPTQGLVVADEASDSDGEQLGRLAEGIQARAVTRYNVTLSPKYDYSAALRDLLLRVLVADGMMLAHTFVTQRSRAIGQVQQLVAGALDAVPPNDRQRLRPLEAAVVSILDRPEPDEEALLDQLASTAFVLCTTLTEPGVLTVAQEMRRRPVYLDASVLLPWLSLGHPTQDVSKAIIESIGDPTVAEFYLNEIVAHRGLALREAEAAGLEDRTRFEWYARMYGLQNINAFLGGFGGAIAKGFAGNLEEYLNENAPYTTEAAAAEFLRKKGLRVATPRYDQAHASFFRAAIRTRLEESGRQRDATRINHDAEMLAILLTGPTANKPYFVTADKVLFAAVAGAAAYHEVLPRILLPYQAAALAQMVKRGAQAVRGLSRTVFGVRRDDIDTLREFYVDRVLEHYEPALLSEIPTIVEAIVTEAQVMQRTLGGFTLGEDDPLERARRFKALDQFEPLFHTRMSEAKKRVHL